MPELTIKLTPKQSEFVSATEPLVLFVGGVGSGKTYAGAVKALLESLNNPGTLGLVVAPTYRLLKDATMRTALEVWGDVVAEVNRQDMRVVFSNGSEVLFRSATAPDRLRGMSVSWVWFDEAAFIPAEVYDVAIARLRQRGIAGKAWITTTPNGKNWVYQLAQTARVVRSPTRDNPFVSREYAERLAERYTSEQRRQELEGEFVEFSGGLIKAEWLRVVDVEPDPQWPSARFYDPALSTATSADYTASVRMYFDGSTYYVGGLVMRRMAYPEFIATVIETAKKEPGVPVYIEGVAYQSAAIQDLLARPEASEVDIRRSIPTKGKVERALPWVARLEGGNLLFLDSCDWREAFSQLVGFPNAAHDDVVDAISGAWEALASRRSIRVY